MRIVFLSLLILPLASISQANRSANQLAHENIQDYITHKIFKDKAYKPLSYQDLVSNKDGTECVWKVAHKFEVGSRDEERQHENTDWSRFSFTFYLNKKLKVVKAEGFHSNP
jgi:hypothetical protein